MIAVIANYAHDAVAGTKFGRRAGSAAEGAGSASRCGGGGGAPTDLATGVFAKGGEGGADRFFEARFWGGGGCGSGVWA